MRKLTRTRLSLVAIFLIFFAPVLVAYLMNLAPDAWRPGETTNRGALVRPARLLSSDVLMSGASETQLGGEVFQGRWMLVLLDGGTCQPECEASLHLMQQARHALGKDMKRVHRLYVAPRGASPDLLADISARYPGLDVATAPPGWLTAFRAGIPADARIWLVDPQGYLMMYFQDEAQRDGILKDLKRLLKLSKIG